MISFCTKYDLINPVQFGFRRGLSTTHLLEDFNDYICSNFDNNKMVICLFVDLRKAFDTINHQSLLRKLDTFGFRGPYKQFFNNYFSDRAQCVRISNCSSNTLPIDHGVPQGSVLGPLLFNIYVNQLGDLPLKSKIFLYADDTVLALACDTYDDGARIIQEDICVLVDWFNINSIFVNTSKTKLLCFHSPHKAPAPTYSVFLHGTQCFGCSCSELDLVHNVKYLGLIFDDTLSWSLQIEEVAKRLRLICIYLYSLRSCCDVSVRKMVYKCLGESIIKYGLTVYGFASPYKLNVINRILNKIAVNLAYGTRYHDYDLQSIMYSFDMLSVHQQCIFDVIMKNYFDDSFKVVNIKVKPLRYTERFVLPRVYTNFGKRSRRFYIPFYFNKLHFDPNIPNFTTVKRLLRQWLSTDA